MAKNLAVCSREYKVMLDHRLFQKRKARARELWRELGRMVRRLDDVKLSGKFNDTKKREIVFLDTPDGTIHLNGLVFRRRADLERDKTEYTLKCRSPDRYVATGANVRSADGDDSGEKLEEDISAPFASRFSHSNTVAGPRKPPDDLKAAAKLFPALVRLEREGRRCSEQLALEPVNSLAVYERVLTGPAFSFRRTEAELALILWSDGPDGRPLVGELSFRYGNDKENFSAKTARVAMSCFAEIQRLDWCLPEGTTKTQFAYRLT
ncbi:MAG: hypothetical protein WD063_20710 [Pirellulales bacterium]